MKLTVTQENLARALQVVGKVASSKAQLPILSNILFKTDNNRLFLAATNLEIAITQHVGSKIDTEGSLTVPARLMSEFITNLPRGNVTLEADGAKLSITSGSYHSIINGMPADEFPALPVIDSKQETDLKALELKRAIQQTVLAASSDDTRPVLTGVFCHSFEGKLYLVATDGYRLAERCLGETNTEISAIVPALAFQETLRVMTDEVQEVRLAFDDNQIRLLIEDIEITSRLIDGNFPPYRQLIPEKGLLEVTADKDEFIRVTKIASLFARDSGGSVAIKFDEDSQKLSVSSVASQIGENSSELDAKISLIGDDMGDDIERTVMLNSRYLLDALGCLDAPKVSLRFSGKNAPCVLVAADKNASYKHVIVPLKS